MVPSTRHPGVIAWVREVAAICQPDNIHWCNGSAAERDSLIQECLVSRELEPLNPIRWPHCYLHRSDPNDVARSEERTFICSKSEDGAGPTNHWMAPAEAYRKLLPIFRGSMKGRSLYVVPFLMGPEGSPFRRIGVQLTDSRYVVLSMRTMTRMGEIAWAELGVNAEFTRCLHGKAQLDPEQRYICHFPQDNTVWSVNSDYGGNALLGKKCMALRLASYQGQQEGWMAEHMMIAGIENPKGEVRYIAAAFPSACGKTNLSMLIPPKSLPGYRIWTLGDDIAWLRIGADGRLWAINPEAGFFGVAPGTGENTNPNALRMVHHSTLFTNVLRTDEGDVWWEGMGAPPEHGVNWQGHEWTPASTERAAHPNARFTTPLTRCPSMSPQAENPQGVPISAIFFGSRRSQGAPLICQSRSWQQGVYFGAALASETTAAANGKTGVLRRDPMAMLPFIGYHAGDYFQHWLNMGERLGAKAPPIFQVNWFRQSSEGRYLWPGYGENLRPLIWALNRCEGRSRAIETPLGDVPSRDSLPMQGLSMPINILDEALHVDPAEYANDLLDQQEFFKKIGNKFPPELWQEHAAFIKRLRQAA